MATSIILGDWDSAFATCPIQMDPLLFFRNLEPAFLPFVHMCWAVRVRIKLPTGSKVLQSDGYHDWTAQPICFSAQPGLPRTCVWSPQKSVGHHNSHMHPQNRRHQEKHVWMMDCSFSFSSWTFACHVERGPGDLQSNNQCCCWYAHPTGEWQGRGVSEREASGSLLDPSACQSQQQCGSTHPHSVRLNGHMLT